MMHYYSIINGHFCTLDGCASYSIYFRKQSNIRKEVQRIIESIVNEVIKILLSQTFSLYKSRKKRILLDQELSRILENVKNEPYYNEISKLIETGGLANQILVYCKNVPTSGKSMDAFCDDVVKACRIETAYQSQVNGVIRQITACFFNSINSPEDPALIAATNTILQSSAKLIENQSALLLQHMKQHEKSADSKEQSLPVPAFINPPYSQNRFFSNREEILKLVREGFASGETVQYLSGKGGIGKTQIALEYAFRHINAYTNIFWVNAETETRLLESYQIIADTMQLSQTNIADLNDATVLQLVTRWMETSERWLCVYDNVEDIPAHCIWWPKIIRGNILITTQKDLLPVGNRIKVAEFSLADAVSFLETRTKLTDPENMEKVAVRLGCLPLALEQAAAYITVNPDTGFAEYADYLDQYGLDVLEETENVMQYDKSVTATMKIAMNQIESGAAMQLLYLCAYLSAEHIETGLFAEYKELLPTLLQKSISNKLSENKVWRELSRYSLLEPQEDQSGYSIHRLLQAVIRRHIGTDQQWLRCCLAVFSTAFDFQYGNVQSHQKFKRLLPHIEAFLGHAAVCFTQEAEQIELARLYTKGGLGQNHLGNFQQALQWHQNALAILENVLGPDHIDTAVSYTNLAEVYNNQANYTQALLWYEKALAIRKKELGENHPDTADIYNSIAFTHYNQGDYSLALQLYQIPLAIQEKNLGIDHPDTADTCNNIAAAYDSLGEYDKALTWYHKALSVREKALGPEHPDTADVYNNIAFTNYNQGDYDVALSWYRQSLAIREKVLGEEHPDTADSYNNIAAVYEARGDYPEALKWYSKSMETREKRFGSSHTDTADSYSNIAMVYIDQGQYQLALEWHQKGLAIREKVLGSQHPDTSISYNNIAMAYTCLCDYPKALEWNQKALAIREKTLGVNHLDTAESYHNIATVLMNLGDYSTSLEWYRKALSIRENVLGAEHPYTADTYQRIATVYNRQNDRISALTWYTKAYTVFLQKLGKEHPETKAVEESIHMLHNE